MSIPELATQLIDNSSTHEDNACTIFLLGSTSVGKTSLLYSFLDKTDTPRETLVLEYSFGRKSSQKQGIEKTICHLWEYGGKLNILRSVLPSIPVNNRHHYCIMVDLSKIKKIWNTLETCLEIMSDVYTEKSRLPELVIFGGKYDLFKNYDAEIKKLICTTLRCIAMIFNAHLVFYSSKEPSLVKRVKDLLHGISFGSGVPNKEKHTNFNKPLLIPKGTDSWENINVPISTLEQVKARHLARFPPDAEAVISEAAVGLGTNHAHPEPSLDSKISLKYDQLRNLETIDISLDDYLMGLSNFDQI